ncbi:MAG: hypothetical protein ACTHMS_17715 [Jatrophihabitans sp.]|uniref:hypothetical protein n=1 Tax=Jatrophihabitans sp. TaxID=1932789 RepID=UPI003F80C649
MFTARLTAAIAATTVAAGLLLGGTVDATARPGPVVATYKPAPGYYALAVGPDAVWALDADEYHDGVLYRLDPRSHAMKLVTTLPFPAGGLVVADGSLWVSDYFGDAVWRLAPSGRVQDEIAVGLQPQWLHAAFGSIWVSNHHGASVSRIDAATDTVVATVPAGAAGVFRNGPQAITDDGTRVYVGSSNQQALEAIDPADDIVTTPASVDDGFCGPIEAAGGAVWSVDNCSSTLYRLSPDGAVLDTFGSTGAPVSLAVQGATVWVGDDTVYDQGSGAGSSAVLEQRDAATGDLLRSVPIGGDAGALAVGFGDLWVYDGVANTVRRVHVG